MKWNLGDPKAFLRHAQNVEYGLDAEVEFAAILRWLGACSFAHCLDQDSFCDSTQGRWIVPDLFAVFETRQSRMTALIEVKTTKGTTIRFKKTYLRSLQGYAALHGHPLLIAWRPRRLGIWMLLDPACAKLADEEHFLIDLEIAFKNDLMSILAGDFLIVPIAGTGLHFETRRISEKAPTKKGYSAKFRIDRVYWRDANGKEYEPRDMPETVAQTIVSIAEPRQKVDESGFVQSFIAPDGTWARAQNVLREAVGFAVAEGQKIHWRKVERNLDAILSRTALLRDVSARFGSFTRYVFFQNPTVRPSFLPERWEHASPV